MKIYLIVVLLVIIIGLCLTKKTYESIENNCNLKKGITNNEDMRCILSELYMKIQESNYEVNEDNVRKDICYRIHEIYKITKLLSNTLKNKGESDIWYIWGTEDVKYAGNIEVQKPNTPIISNNDDYEKFISLFLYMDDFTILVEKMNIWKEVEATDENGNRKMNVKRMCKHHTKQSLEDKQTLSYARHLMKKIGTLTEHFFHQHNNYKQVSYGDSKDTKMYL